MARWACCALKAKSFVCASKIPLAHTPSADRSQIVEARLPFRALRAFLASCSVFLKLSVYPPRHHAAAFHGIALICRPLDLDRGSAIAFPRFAGVSGEL